MEENSVRDLPEQLVKNATEHAVGELYRKENDLLADGAHERSLTSKSFLSVLSKCCT